MSQGTSRKPQHWGDGLRALLRGLAAHNRGLCLIITRQRLPELATAKSEIRRSKSETNPKSESRKWEVRRASSTCARGRTIISISAFGLRTSFGFRISTFGFLRRVDFQKVNQKEQGGHAFRVIAAYEELLRGSGKDPGRAVTNAALAYP